MNENCFQSTVRYGSLVLAVGVILNVWLVMRYIEVYRDASKAEIQVQQIAAQQQILQSLLQEFSTRASSDKHIAEIFQRAQAGGAPPASMNPKMGSK